MAVNVNLDCDLDVDVDKPDEKSIMTYVAQFLKHHPDRQETEIGRQQEEVRHYSISHPTTKLQPALLSLYVSWLNAYSLYSVS